MISRASFPGHSPALERDPQRLGKLPPRGTRILEVTPQHLPLRIEQVRLRQHRGGLRPEGLAAGDSVVTAGQLKIQDGAPVAVVPSNGAAVSAAEPAES